MKTLKNYSLGESFQKIPEEFKNKQLVKPKYTVNDVAKNLLRNIPKI